MHDDIISSNTPTGGFRDDSFDQLIKENKQTKHYKGPEETRPCNCAGLGGELRAERSWC